MNLTLDIISSNGQSLGPARRKVFGPEGGRIGRSPDCDWIISNPYISRHHATVRWISGSYYIESTGENGVALGSPQGIIPKLERRPLRHGDHLFIDEYEVVVGLDSVTSDLAAAPVAGPGLGAGAFVPADDPFDLAPTREVRALPNALPTALEPSAEELDPLKQFGRTGSPVVTAPRPESSWNHSPGVSDHFAPPAAASLNPSGGAIPDDWDATSFGRARVAQPAPQPAVAPSAPSARTAPSVPPARTAPSALPARTAPSAPPARTAPPPASAIPDDWDKTNFGRKSAPAAPPPTPTPGVRAPAVNPGAAPRRAAPGAGAGAAGAAAGPAGAGAMTGAAERARVLARAPGAAAATPSASSAAAAAGAAAGAATAASAATGGFDVAALLKSAGVDPAGLPADTAASLGLILRSVVQGVIDVLRARAEIKEQFRLSQTIVKTAENNPLKFAVNAEDALASLLGRRNPAYLPPVEAFEDAFADIRCHQLAMLAGMRAGFDQVMSRFDPQQLQEGFDKRARRGGLLSMSSKSRYWEQFVEEFQELAGDRERAFRRLFAEEFASAYEKQLEMLKRSHSKQRR